MSHSIAFHPSQDLQWSLYGPHALMIQFADEVGEKSFQRLKLIQQCLETHSLPGLYEYVPAFTKVLLEFDPNVVPNPAQIVPDLIRLLEKQTLPVSAEVQVKKIPVIYNGQDLPDLAAEKKLSIEEFCALHAEPVYRVYMLGFSPGFPYLGDLNPQLVTPLRSSPRARIKAGSVAIGGTHTGIYTIDSPGGWHVIGTAQIKIFDPRKGYPLGPDEAMFFLRPGDRVKFIPVT